MQYDIEGILPKGPYLPCVSMAGRALLAGYHQYISHTEVRVNTSKRPKFEQGCCQRASRRCCTSQEFTNTSWKICTLYSLGKIQAPYQFINYLELHCSSCLFTKSSNLNFIYKNNTSTLYSWLKKCALNWRPPGNFCTPLGICFLATSLF